MNKETSPLRQFRDSVRGDVVISCGDLQDLRDLTADAIEAVEAQVAEAVARVAALEKRHEDLAAWCAETEAKVAALEKKPAPSAVPAPRGFREGDICRVIESKRTKENFLVGCEGRINPYRGIGGDWVIDCGTAKGVRCFYNSELTLVRAADAPEAPAEEDTGLVVQRIRDEATKPLHVEIEKLRGEVARLTAERDEAQGASILNANAVRLQKARAEAAEKELAEARAISAPTAERVRNETQIATELRKDLADANGARDRLVRELSGERVERDYWKTRAEDVTKERDALRADLAAIKGQYDAQTRSYNWVSAECGALRLASLMWFNEKGEPELLATAEEVTERRKAAAKELAALRAKPRFRTRKVTAADVRALDDEWAKSKYGGRDSWSKAMNAVGLRRRVEQSK